MDSVTGEVRGKVDQANPDAESGPDAGAGEMRRMKDISSSDGEWALGRLPVEKRYGL